MILTIPLTWSPSDEPDVAGYWVRWGVRGKVKGWKAVGLLTGATSLHLAIPVRRSVVYEIRLSAYDVAGNESAQRVLTSVYVA